MHFFCNCFCLIFYLSSNLSVLKRVFFIFFPPSTWLLVYSFWFLIWLFALGAAIFYWKLLSRPLLLPSDQPTLFLLLRLSPFRFAAIMRFLNFLSNAWFPFFKALYLDSFECFKQFLDLDPFHYLFVILMMILFFLACSLFENRHFATFSWTF